MSEKYRFVYPDIPHTDRILYDYLFSLDRVIRAQGEAIKELSERLNNASKRS